MRTTKPNIKIEPRHISSEHFNEPCDRWRLATMTSHEYYELDYDEDLEEDEEPGIEKTLHYVDGPAEILDVLQCRVLETSRTLDHFRRGLNQRWPSFSVSELVAPGFVPDWRSLENLIRSELELQSALEEAQAKAHVRLVKEEYEAIKLARKQAKRKARA